MRPIGVHLLACSGVLVVLAVAGCAAPAPSAPTSPASPAASPAGEPASAPPIGFTDLEKRPGWVVGTVTRGGDGPCYGFLTEGGETLALHSPDGLTLRQGATVRIQVMSPSHRTACGEGTPTALRAVEPVG